MLNNSHQRGTFLVVRWLRLSLQQGLGIIPGRGTKILHAAQPSHTHKHTHTEDAIQWFLVYSCIVQTSPLSNSRTFLLSQNEIPYLLAVSPNFSFLQALSITIHFSCRQPTFINLPILDIYIHIKAIIQYVAFDVCLILLRITFLRFIPVVACINISFHFKAE